MVSIIKVQDEEEALAVANVTSYGLSAAAVRRDLECGACLARRLQAGMTHVNHSPVNDLPNCPWRREEQQPRAVQRPAVDR
jgi:aldehyde dehydrogenase (NAD+)